MNMILNLNDLRITFNEITFTDKCVRVIFHPFSLCCMLFSSIFEKHILIIIFHNILHSHSVFHCKFTISTLFQAYSIHYEIFINIATRTIHILPFLHKAHIISQNIWTECDTRFREV